MQPLGQALVASGQNLFQDPNVTFHILGNLQRVVEAVDELADEAGDQLINELRDSLLHSQEANNTLQECLVLANRRIQVLENTVARSDEQRQNATRALQEQINALQMRAQADAEKIATLEASEEANKKTIVSQNLMLEGVRALLM